MAEAGSAPRIPAPDIEALVVGAVRQHLQASENSDPIGDHALEPRSQDLSHHPDTDAQNDLVRTKIARVVVSSREIQITLKADAATDTQDPSQPPAETELRIRWTPKALTRRKGLRLAVSGEPELDEASRRALLLAIARSRSWVEDLLAGRVASFDDIADREGLGARYVVRLSALAFLSPRIVAAIASGQAPPGTTITALTDSTPLAWSEQEQRFGLR